MVTAARSKGDTGPLISVAHCPRQPAATATNPLMKAARPKVSGSRLVPEAVSEISLPAYKRTLDTWECALQ